MKKTTLTNLEISDLCRELSLLLHSGVGLSDGLALLTEEEKDFAQKKRLEQMTRHVEEGGMLPDAFAQEDCFPTYVVGLLHVGEHVGRTEEALAALARYYEERDRMNRQVRSALAYPAILLLLMLMVIAVLLIKVLPVFHDVYASLGGQLTGVAGGLLLLGQRLDAAMPVLLGALAVAALAAALFAMHNGFREWATTLWRGRWGDCGVFRKLNNARFAQALSMGMSSGLLLEDAVGLSGKLLQDTPAAAARCQKCRHSLEEGVPLSKALEENNMLPASACRMLVLGMRSGSGDQVMEEIARCLSEDAEQALQSAVSKVEPALILITSLLVGAILLSVMLPLMNIMTSIG